MKKLENKIINKIYKMETRKTFSQILLRLILVCLTVLSVIFIYSIIVEILNEQGSFDLYNFLSDDFEVVRYYFFHNTWLFVQELPLPLVCILILLVVVFILLIYTLIKNFSKVKNKLVAIYKFWFK